MSLPLWKVALQYLMESLVMIAFFSRFSLQRALPMGQARPVWRRALGLGVLLVSNAMLYFFSAWFSGVAVRFLYRCAGCILYVRIAISDAMRQVVYISGCGVLLFTACQNISLVPILHGIYNAEVAFVGVAWLDVFLCCVLCFFCFCAVFAVVGAAAPIRADKEIGAERYVMVWVICLTEAYLREIIHTAGRNVYLRELSLYPLLLQGALLLLFIMWERYLHSKQQQTELRLQEMLNHYRLKNLAHYQSGESAIRELHHDMKNHLSLLQRIATQESASETIAYIDQLSKRLHPYESLVQTGNPFLDGILSEKCAEGRQAGIRMDIQLDFSQGDFLQPADLCTIFGNMLDNALEASQSVRRQEQRYIRLRGYALAGQLLVQESNRFEGTLRQEGGVLRTTKQHGHLHGFGLKSLRSTVKRYGGTVTLDTETEHEFVMRLVIPIAVQEARPT